MLFFKHFGIIIVVITCTLNLSSGLQCYSCLYSNHPLAEHLGFNDASCYTGRFTNYNLLKTCNSGERCVKMSVKVDHYAVVRGCHVFSRTARNRCERADLAEVNRLYPGWSRLLGGSSINGNTCVCNTNKCNSGWISWS